ncbi:hypothetical protein [Aeromicrobium sp. 179-A 4D2 NHS]|uniref:hypothetical protein n=1 Tax=Aeromicrobium sp. 179-A 4D2 NHS TaxID=3142375 RepID=UPI00399F95C1
MKTRILALLAVPVFALSACTITIGNPDGFEDWTDDPDSVQYENTPEDEASIAFHEWLTAVAEGDAATACVYMSDVAIAEVASQEGLPENSPCEDTIPGLTKEVDAREIDVDNLLTTSDVDGKDGSVVVDAPNGDSLLFLMRNENDEWLVDPIGLLRG